MSHTNVLSWFKGKALANAQAALAALDASEERGCWLKGTSSKVRAALTGKANVAVNLGARYGKLLEQIGNYDTPQRQQGWNITFMLRYGYISSRHANLDFAAVRAATSDHELQSVIDQAERFAADMAPIAATMDRLDATRAKPIFTSLGLSPTTTATLHSLGLEDSGATVRVCEIDWTKIESVDEHGRKTYRYVGQLTWPEGTVHGASKYAKRTHSNNRQCEACGHAIKNAYNWVPLIMDDSAGVPHSLWVGRDCAKNLFGINVSGDIELNERAHNGSSI